MEKTFVILEQAKDKKVKMEIDMKLYFAPIDGVTGRIYRNAFTKFFVSPDKYFAPFISPCHNPKLKGKEIRELLPENNENINLVPQIMANNPEIS